MLRRASRFVMLVTQVVDGANVSRASGRLGGRDRESVTVTGGYEQKEMSFGPGTYVVRTSQPLGLLAAYLLEPESDDGLVTWNFLDAYLGPQKVLPIYKLMTPRVLKDLRLSSHTKIEKAHGEGAD